MKFILKKLFMYPFFALYCIGYSAVKISIILLKCIGLIVSLPFYVLSAKLENRTRYFVRWYEIPEFIESFMEDIDIDWENEYKRRNEIDDEYLDGADND